MDMRRIAVIWFAVWTIFGVDRATAHRFGKFQHQPLFGDSYRQRRGRAQIHHRYG